MFPLPRAAAVPRPLVPFALALAAATFSATSAQAQAPAGADPVVLTLETGGRSYEPGVAIIAKPRQALALELAVSSAGYGSRRSASPIIDNAPEGRGKGSIGVASEERVDWEWSAGLGLDASGRSLTWRAPESGGHCVVTATYSRTGRAGRSETRQQGRASFDILALKEYDPSSFMLDGTAIGVYPDPARDDNPPSAVANYPSRYAIPRWFLKSSPETNGLRLSPNFTVGDFAMDPKRFGDSQYILVDPELLDRLERIRAIAASKGLGPRVRVLRAYLTPLAAEALRREGASVSEYSRFLYGDAAAIIIDGDNDGRLDDLDGNGSIDGEDALVLGDIVEEVEREIGPGGLGVYGEAPDSTLPQTPFVHIDARGGRARWEYKVR